MSEQKIRDIGLLFKLWHDDTLKVEDIARTFRVALSTVSATAKRHGLRPRGEVVDGIRHDRAAIDLGVENLSQCESLRLDDWTEERARPIREAWSEDERYQRRVHKIQPVCYGGVYW